MKNVSRLLFTLAVASILVSCSSGDDSYVSNAIVTTFAGSGAQGSSDSTTGTLATFNNPAGIVSAGTNLIVADYGSDLIRNDRRGLGRRGLGGRRGNGGYVQ